MPLESGRGTGDIFAHSTAHHFVQKLKNVANRSHGRPFEASFLRCVTKLVAVVRGVRKHPTNLLVGVLHGSRTYTSRLFQRVPFLIVLPARRVLVDRLPYPLEVLDHLREVGGGPVGEVPDVLVPGGLR